MLTAWSTSSSAAERRLVRGLAGAYVRNQNLRDGAKDTPTRRYHAGVMEGIRMSLVAIIGTKLHGLTADGELQELVSAEIQAAAGLTARPA